MGEPVGIWNSDCRHFPPKRLAGPSPWGSPSSGWQEQGCIRCARNVALPTSASEKLTHWPARKTGNGAHIAPISLSETYFTPLLSSRFSEGRGRYRQELSKYPAFREFSFGTRPPRNILYRRRQQRSR